MAVGEVDTVFGVLDLSGVLANALIGGAVARSHDLDPVGFATLAVLSGLGGGVLRDVLLQHGPPTALTDYRYIITALVGAALSFLIEFRGRLWEARLWPLIDAVALGCWATTGAQKTLQVGMGWLAAILLGIVTAVGGGATRDLVVRKIPGVLGGNTLYASAAGIAATAFVIAAKCGPMSVAQLVGLVSGAGVCLVARWRGWILPGADAWSAPTVRRVVARVRSPDLHSHTRSEQNPTNAEPNDGNTLATGGKDER